jgi:hypothetical protein
MSNLTRNQVRKLLRDSICIRVPELDIGISESYQLSDGRILVDFNEVGGTTFESRGELENWLREKAAEQKEFDATYIETPTASARYTYTGPISSAQEEMDRLCLEYRMEQLSQEEKEFELSPSDKLFLISFVRYFRPLGFYKEYESLSENDLVEQLGELWYEEVESEIDSTDQYVDLFLLQWDSDRVWWRDMEADVCMGNEVYVGMIERLSEISHDAFLVRNITELWDSPQGDIRVCMTMHGRDYCLSPKYQGDWLDIDVIEQINTFIQRSDYRFELVPTGMQMAFVTALTASEKQQLHLERGWVFRTT